LIGAIAGLWSALVVALMSLLAYVGNQARLGKLAELN